MSLDDVLLTISAIHALIDTLDRPDPAVQRCKIRVCKFEKYFRTMNLTLPVPVPNPAPQQVSKLALFQNKGTFLHPIRATFIQSDPNESWHSLAP